MHQRPFRKRRPFTLVEVLFVSGISVIVLATTMSLFIMPMLAWRDTVYSWMVDSQARMVRERMLRCVRPGQAGVGLRSASRAVAKPGSSTQAEWLDFDVDTRELPVPADNKNYASWRILWNRGQDLATKDAGKSQAMLPPPLTVTRAAFAQPTADTLTAQVDLQATRQGRVYARTINLNVYLINK